MQHARMRLVFIGLALILFGSFAEHAYADTTYTVAPGDTLTRIAIRFHVSVSDIMQANNIRNPNNIFDGQQLRIPDGIASVASIASSRVKPPESPPVYTPAVAGAKWIDVNLTKQTMTAMEGNVAVRTTLISTGITKHPTITGTFHIYVKLRSAPMTGGSRAGGDYYSLPNVPNIMYFYGSYAIHGAYWHHNFGHPMSHGCVNENLTDAKWFFDWAGPKIGPGMDVAWATPSNPGTTVVVHN